MEKSIYICSTYYHVLIALVRSIDELKGWDLLITNYINGGQLLAERIRQNDTFDCVYVTRDVREYVPKNRIDAVFFGRRKNSVRLEQEIPVDLRKYQRICAFHDDIWITHYLKIEKISYWLLEDALNSLATIAESPFHYMLPRRNFKSWLKKQLNLQYRFFQECRYVQLIEVNSKDGLQIPVDNKVVEYPREIMFSRLEKRDKNKLLHIFLPELDFFCKGQCLLLLTQPLYEDGIVKTEDLQKRIYQYILKHYTNENDVICIKPHPRDNVSYNYQNVVVLDKNFPIEILNYCEDISFKKALTAFSTAIDSLEFVSEKIFLGFETLNKIKREVEEYGEL